MTQRASPTPPHNPDTLRRHRRDALILTCALWSLHFLLLNVRSAIVGVSPLDLVTQRLLWTLAGIGVCALVFVALDRLTRRPFWVQVIATFALAGPVGAVYSFVRANVMGNELAIVDHFDTATYWLWFFLAWAASILALNYNMRAALEQEMRLTAQALENRARVQALRYQLSPHFLFNTLNSIAALGLDGKAEAAEEMIRRLSDFLRSALAVGDGDDVPLLTELQQQQNYLDVETIRFPDRMHVKLFAPPEIRDALVPSLILQPLIENAIRHGVAKSSSLTNITVNARAHGQCLHISVTNTGANAPAEAGLGVGLQNVKARLEARFGSAAGLTTGARADGGFCAEIHLPLRFAA
jgi:signal transduction histidine kinase